MEDEYIIDCYPEDYDPDTEFRGKFPVEKQEDGKTSVAKAVIVVACIGLICAIIDFYIDKH